MGPLRGVTLRFAGRDGKKSCAEVANICGENGPSIREIAKKEKEVGAGFAVATGTAKVTKLRAQRVRSAWLPWRRCEACEWETGTGNLARLMTCRPESSEAV